MQEQKTCSSVQMIFFRQNEVHQRQDVYEKQNSISQRKIHIKLSQWQLHAVGGFHWIFNWKNNNHKDEFQEQCHMKYFNDKYLMRVTPNKYVRQLLKERKKYFIDLIEYTRRKSQGKTGTKPSPQSQDYFDQRDKTQNQDQIDTIVQIIYSQFLSEIRKQLNINHDNNDEQVLFSSLTQGILEQSQKYFFLPSLSTNQSYKQTQAFLSEIVEEILCIWLRNLTQNETKQVKNQLRQLQLCVKNHLIEHPINYRKVCSSINGVNFFITFEQNLTSQKSFPGSFFKDLGSYVDCQSTGKQQLKCFYQLFQAKPKTVLPDVYSYGLIEEFVNQYHSLFYKYGQNNAKLQQFSQIQQKSQPKDKTKIQHSVNKQALIEIIQRSSLSSKRQLNQGNNFIEQTKSEQTSLNSLKFNIQSTRWFKKNSLTNKTKKKHSNPLIFFKSSFIPEYLQNTQNPQKIDFYRPKHLRGRTQFTIFPCQQSSKKVQNINQKPQNYNYDQNNFRYFRSQSQSQGYKQNQVTSVQEHILREIARKKYPIEFNKKSLVPGSKSTAQISLIDEILALQMMDCVGFDEKTKIPAKETTVHQPMEQQFDTVIQLRDKLTQLQSLLKTSYVKRQNQKTKSVSRDNSQSLYPSLILKSLKNIIEPNVYKKATVFRQILKKIIFSSPKVQSEIIKCLETSTFHPHYEQFEKSDILIPIKTHLFHIVSFLISLTWRDISLMIQSVRFLSTKSEAKSSLSDEKRFLSYRFIDIHIKPVKSIQTNIEKDKQFLFYYCEYQKMKRFDTLIDCQKFN